jgi:hypothetical protein
LSDEPKERQMIYLTVRNTSGGNHGHQLKDLIGGYTIAKVFGFTYAHTYYPYLEHFAVADKTHVEDLDPNIPHVRFSGPFWNGMRYEHARQLFGRLGQHDASADLLVSIENALRIFPCQTIQWHKQGLIKNNVFEDFYTELSDKYSQKHTDRGTPFDKDRVHIAAHINRGESYDRVKYPRHFTSDWNVRHMFDLSYFENIWDQLRGVLANKSAACAIHIYTEQLNSEEIVERFSAREDITLHIGQNRNQGDDELARTIFHDFVTSDIFIPCNSSFSAMACYYRKGKPTIYHPHAHLFDLPETDFYPTDANGRFDVSRLRRLLGK